MKLNTVIASCAIVMGIATSCNSQGFEKTPRGLEYKYIQKGNGTYQSKPGDVISMNLIFKIGDSVLIDTRSLNNNQPVEQPLNAPSYNGDVFEGLLMMKDGDKMEFRTSADSLFAASHQPAPEWAKKGAKATWNVEVIKVMNKEEIEKEHTEKIKKQAAIEDTEIINYLKANNIAIKPEPSTPLKANSKVAYKDASGIYYIVQKAGTGNVIGSGGNVSVNYTGKTLQNEVFDSNIDPQFNHVEPIKFVVGQGQMIKGWDIVLPKMRVGDKVTAILPSATAYGERGAGAKIKPYAVLLFDIELLSVE